MKGRTDWQDEDRRVEVSGGKGLEDTGDTGTRRGQICLGQGTCRDPRQRKADQLAKEGAELGDEDEGIEKVLTEMGLRQEWERRRAEVRKVKGSGMGRLVRWIESTMSTATL